MLGVSRQTKTARHDRHAVEQDAVERRIGIRKYLAPGHKSSYVYDYRTHLLIIVLLIKVNARERRHANCRSQLYRSEEHTSELQSLMRLSYAVFCLTKKNKINKQYN